MEYSLGVDVGSVNCRTVVLDQSRVAYRDIERVITTPSDSVRKLFKRLSNSISLSNIRSASYSGQGKTLFDNYGWEGYSASLALATGILSHHPDARTIICIGGQTALVVELEQGLERPWKVHSNPLCAAGTGRFLEQQSYRLGIDLGEFAASALACSEAAPRIATRCSVFAKSDLIHLQQKGVNMPAMLYSLCESVARMVTSLKKGAFEPPIYLAGGVSANPAVRHALAKAISERNGASVEINMPAEPGYVQAEGLAILARGKNCRVIMPEELDITGRYFKLPALKGGIEAYRSGEETTVNSKSHRAYLGVDVGSTSTKAVLVDTCGNVLAKDYLMTAGRPVEAVKQVFRNLVAKGADSLEIAGAGVTGSGRYLIGSLIGADLVKNEITAQVRAAREIDPKADIIEIGGQDSKLVIKRNGAVVDYQMNKACAAGTGSFIDEMAEMLSLSVRSGEFARLALCAPYTVDLGTRCAAFMGQAVTSAQQENIPLEVIAASLANSIASNYLTKVVGNRKLGDKVILTGAVFYNQAVVAAFRDALGARKAIVATHREVSGAIGAALLTAETGVQGQSNFRGFEKVITGESKLSSFVCTSCENNCTVTRMATAEGGYLYFGSRCDKYDAKLKETGRATLFDQREKLLFSSPCPEAGSLAERPLVGIPRALMVYDYAPLLSGFLSSLGTRVKFSPISNKSLIEKAVELSYSDSCFPLKLAHGHIHSLADCDYILYPSALRLGKKAGSENQRYSCPLVQASPYITRQSLDLSDRLLTPIIDYSAGQAETIENFTRVAEKMGLPRATGRQAVITGLAAQDRFKSEIKRIGSGVVHELKKKGMLGVVIISRSYMAQDRGANLGICEKLAGLGVVPIPLDMLPLESIDVTKYSDRPYWEYESRFIAAAALTAAEKQLYGLVLTNFGCGPDSFILKILEDISAGKPLGQLEIDEHAAEAGLVTRLEAFVDTIREHAASPANSEPPAPHKVYRGASSRIDPQRKVIIPNMASHARILDAVMHYYGVDSEVLPEADETDLLLAGKFTRGTECLPFRVTLGGFLRFLSDNPDCEFQGFMSGSYGPCRLGKYAIEQGKVLRDMGREIPICTSVSNNAYRDLNMGPGFERIAWNGIVAIDQLERLLWHTRPYCPDSRAADEVFEDYLTQIASRIRTGRKYQKLLRLAAADFERLVDTSIAQKPLVGINGEIFLRTNRFSNDDLVKVCEQFGLEVIVSPMGEWFKYTAYRNLEDALKDRRVKKVMSSYLKKRILEHDEAILTGQLKSILDGRQPSTREILAMSGKVLSPRCGSEAVLSLGSGIEWMKNPEFSGVISVMPHGCMPGGIVAAMAEKLSSKYSKPWLSLTYDGFKESNNLFRIQNFAEIVKFSNRQGG